MTTTRHFLSLLLVTILASVSCSAEQLTASGIGSKGGDATLLGGKVSISVPPGALNVVVQFTATSPSSFPVSPLLVAGSVVDVAPAILSLNQPIRLRLSFASLTLPEGARSEEIKLCALVSGTWIPVNGSRVNVAEGWVESNLVEALGTFALLGEEVGEVIVAPSAASREVGQSVQLSAVPRSLSGALLPQRPVTWQSSAPSVAAVTQSGLVTTLGSGNAVISARSALGLPGTSSISVSAPASALYPNEPAGFTPFLEHSLGVLPSGTNGATGSWYNTGGGQLSIVQPSDGTPRSAGVANIVYPRGWQGGFSPAKFGHESQTQRGKLHFSMHIRIAGSDYENHPVFTKIGFIGHGREPSGPFNEGYWVLRSPTSSRIQTSLFLEFRQQNHITRNLLQNVNTAPLFTVGPWHQIELLAELHALGTADGRLRMWLDGTSIVDYSDVVFRNAANPAGFRGWKIDPTYGGVGKVKMREDIWQIDHVYASGTPLP